MADDKLNVNPALHQDGDDTVTRKTIKLRPAMAPGAMAVKPAPAPAAPRPASNTDTGNIDLADDTQTRRTIKLKPIGPMTAKPAAPAPAAVPTPAPTTVAPAPAAAPATAKADGEDTVTRKTIKLRPAMVSGASAAKPAAPAAAPAPAPAPAAEESGEKTIRIQRPSKPANKPVGPVVVGTAPVVAKPAPTAPKVAPAAQAAPKLPPLQKTTAPSAIEPAGTSLDVTVASADEDIFAIPPKAYLGIALAALILMIYSTLLITVQFLDITQGQDSAAKVSFMVPGPKAK